MPTPSAPAAFSAVTVASSATSSTYAATNRWVRVLVWTCGCAGGWRRVTFPVNTSTGWVVYARSAYGFKAFAGDRSVLLNAQYWLDADRH